jgi:hypothetical protein
LDEGWVILVWGAKLLTCPKKSIALDAVRRAKVLLLQQSSTDVAMEPHDVHEGSHTSPDKIGNDAPVPTGKAERPFGQIAFILPRHHQRNEKH